MSGEDQNKLDELFKSGLGQPDTHFEYHPGDWDDMEQLLDARSKGRGIAYLWPVLSGIAAALLIFLGWWFFKPVAVEPAQVAVVKHQPIQQAPDTRRPGAIVSTQGTMQKSNNVAKSAGGRDAGETYKAISHSVRHHTNQAKAHILYTGNKAPHAVKSALQAQKMPVSSNNNTPQMAMVTNNPAQTAQATTAPVTDPSQVNGSVNTMAATTTPVAATAVGNKPAPDQPANITTPAMPDNSRKIKTARPSNHGAQIGLAMMLSPDINGAGSFQKAKVGTNIGLMLSVGITKNLTISTGAAYSRKPYEESFSSYASTYKFKTDPQAVYADCRVLDIPVNVDYKVYNRNKNSFSVGSGLSSYIMLNEKYTYNYADPSTAGPVDYVVANKNKHLFGVMNLNATFEHQVSPKISIAAQPYLKVPLTDIGYSKVRLQSAGIALGVRWRLHQ